VVGGDLGAGGGLGRGGDAGAATGGLGHLAQGVDDAAGQVAAGEGGRHGQHGKGGDAVRHAAAGGGAGDDLDLALTGGDDEQDGGVGALAEGGVQLLGTGAEVGDAAEVEVADEDGDRSRSGRARRRARCAPAG
jgi:hypothetical protein